MKLSKNFLNSRKGMDVYMLKAYRIPTRHDQECYSLWHYYGQIFKVIGQT